MQSNYLPPLEPIGDFRSYVCGDVVIDETAAIASGVLLQADQGGKIMIAAGVCIGMGAVLHAQGGLLEICAGANLGAGVLVYGTSKIGEGACIGASSSIVRAVIAKGAIVPPCSLISGLEQSSVEKEASPAIAQELGNAPASPTNYSFTHTYSSAKPLTNPDLGTESTAGNIAGRSTTETHIHTNVTATTDSFVANSVERRVTETQVEIPTGFVGEAISEPALEAAESQAVADNAISELVSPIDSSLVSANSDQAKTYAKAQINRYIKRLFPNN